MKNFDFECFEVCCIDVSGVEFGLVFWVIFVVCSWNIGECVDY